MVLMIKRRPYLSPQLRVNQYF